jgi:hypothetical protein
MKEIFTKTHFTNRIIWILLLWWVLYEFVDGTLMYEKLTDGLFFEVGGTSTDISCVKDGKVMIRYAEVGGHKTYLNSLDVRTVGIGGGSMVEIKNGKAVNTGPRSAHIEEQAVG